MGLVDRGVRRVGGYELVRRLGRGGMGEVWLARVEKLEGLVKWLALKVVPLQADVRPDALLREARVALLLSHSNIVGVFDAGVDGDVGYVAMEWVDGIDLAHLLKVQRELIGGVIGERVAAFVTVELLRALAYAHGLSHGGLALQLVHRDISPSNLLVSRDGEVKLLDFGIARSRLSSTTDDAVRGKVRYMAPEQFAGTPVDARADLYAVGAILHEMLAGQPLRGGASTAEVMGQIASGAVPELGVAVSPALDAVRRWLLQPDPGQRASSANQVLEWLRAQGCDGDASRELAAMCQAIAGGPSPVASAVRLPRDEHTDLGGDATLPAGPGDRTTHTHAPLARGTVPRSRGPSRRLVIACVAVVLAAGLGLYLAMRWLPRPLEGELDVDARARVSGVTFTFEPEPTTPPPQPVQPRPAESTRPAAPTTSTPAPSASPASRVKGPDVRQIENACPVDLGGDGVLDLVGQVYPRSKMMTVLSLATIDGATGVMREMTSHPELDSEIEVTCLAHGMATYIVDDRTTLVWSADDLSTPRQTISDAAQEVELGDGCFTVRARARTSFDARTFEPIATCVAQPKPDPRRVRLGDAEATLVHDWRRTPLVFEVEHTEAGTTPWSRRLDSPASRSSIDTPTIRGTMTLAMTRDHVWTVALADGWQTNELVALARTDGSTALAIGLGKSDPDSLIVDDHKLLVVFRTRVCAFELVAGKPLWCFGEDDR